KGAIWRITGPQSLFNRSAGATPTLGELRENGVEAGFSPEIHQALTHTPGLLRAVAHRVLNTYFPETLHGDIAAEVGLDLESVERVAPLAKRTVPPVGRRRRDPSFRERVLLAYEFRCCVCGF